MNEFILLLLSTALVNNVVLIKFLGLCPVMGVSKSVDSALGMGLATTFVITLAAGASWMLDNWLLAPFGLGYLRILTFILVIAAVVQFTEMFIRKASPALYQSLGIYLPLITTNCAVLGVALLNVEQKLSLFKSLLYGFGSALGFTLVLLVFAGLRERVALARVPAAFAGAPISFITISLMPGSNCGQCGFAGCSAAATAIAEGVASPACCPPGGKALAVVIAVRLGITVDLSSDFVGDGWGVHPADHKRPAADSPSRSLPLPQRLHLMLAQHVGAAARPVVLVGQKVKKGELIAAAHGNISAPLHASTSGTISAIGEITAPHASGLPGMAISIDADGDDAWLESERVSDPFALSPGEIAARVAAAGVVGLGGATFPSSVKLNLGRRSKIDTLIINGSECEPYLSCDDRLMRDRAADVVSGIRLMLIATGARQARVGIEDNKPEAIAAMREAVRRFGEIIVELVPARYPMGRLPLEMSARIHHGEMESAVALGLSDCIACGCCAYVCPAHIPLVQYFYHAKGELSARQRTQLRSEATRKMAQARQERLEREAREKAEAVARRKAERSAQQAALKTVAVAAAVTPIAAGESA